MLFKLSYLNSNFALTLGYLNPALNNPTKGETFYDRAQIACVQTSPISFWCNKGNRRRLHAGKDQKVDKVEIYQFFNTVPIYAGMLIVG